MGTALSGAGIRTANCSFINSRVAICLYSPAFKRAKPGASKTGNVAIYRFLITFALRAWAQNLVVPPAPAFLGRGGSFSAWPRSR